MKTLSDLIRDIFAVRSDRRKPLLNQTKKPEISPVQNQPESAPASVNKPISLTPKTNSNETETAETPRHPRVDNPDAWQNPRNNEEIGSTISGGVIASQSPAEPAIGNKANEVSEDSTGLSDYERGRIDGRNERIEEIYFPKTDDGIPHFRGRPAKPSSGPDIFSMAREA